MKLNLFKYIAPAALAAAMALGCASCADDLNQSSIDPQTTPSVSQQAYYAKIYGLMVLTGQKGATDAPDISDDPGRNPFFRRVWEANEFPTDECVWTWQNDAGQPEYVNFTWNDGHTYTSMLYNRLGYNITQCNCFLDLYGGKSDAESVRQCAEVRFFRAMYYQYYLDMFGKAPFSTTVSGDMPVEKAGADLFSFIESEYLAIEPALDPARPDAETFGRVNKAAVWMMLSRLYLNAEVYTGTPRWADARDYADKVIRESGYSLSKQTSSAGYSGYQQLFMGDNDQNAEAMKEIILPIRQDGLQTRTYGGTWTIISSCYGGDMPNFYGTNDAWTCIRSRERLVKMFIPDLANVPMTENPADIRNAANDDRALFYSGSADAERKAQTETITRFQDGLAFTKWTNLHSDGTTNYHDSNIPDTDIPFIRLAEAYLTRAEANWRLNPSDATPILDDINELRSRAHATLWTSLDISETGFIEEWGREFYLEGRRRSDLVRFDAFTTGKYLWDWKGGIYAGTAVQSKYNLFPIPASDLTNNPNMHQNEGF